MEEDQNLDAGLFAPAPRWDYPYAPGDIGAPDHVPAGLDPDAWDALVAARESGNAPIPTTEHRPLWPVYPDSIAPTAVACPVADPFTARVHDQMPDGRVTRRGRAAIVGGLRPRFQMVWQTDPDTGHRARVRVPIVDAAPADAVARDASAELRHTMAAVELAAVDRNAAGLVQSLALSRIANRIYDLDPLVGTDAMSWEEITAGGPDAAAALLTHRNFPDPVAALVTHRIHPRAYLPFVDSSVWDDIVTMATHHATYRPTITRHPVRLAIPKGRKRATDPTGTATELRAPHTDTDRLVWIGHRLMARGETVRTQRARARTTAVRRTRATEMQVPNMATGLLAAVTHMGRGTAVVIAHQTHRIRVRRDAHGRWDVTVTGPTGQTRRNNGRRTADGAARAVVDAIRATDPDQRAADMARAATITPPVHAD